MNSEYEIIGNIVLKVLRRDDNEIISRDLIAYYLKKELEHITRSEMSAYEKKLYESAARMIGNPAIMSLTQL
ncbi:hypothetical protein [Atlantibacter sp.]|uniref:hypothetical protein n=1 Tax=Atlantibacter sp. TaxID=1903473 RepID=UPI0028A64F9F|nr:hypothetical protein [Atlantibacter sp.]